MRWSTVLARHEVKVLAGADHKDFHLRIHPQHYSKRFRNKSTLIKGYIPKYFFFQKERQADEDLVPLARATVRYGPGK